MRAAGLLGLLLSGVLLAQNDARDRVYYPGDSEGAKPLARKLTANIWLDQKDIWRSPFRMRSRDARWWIGIGAATAALIATDRRASAAVADNPNVARWGGRISNIASAYSIAPIIAGYYAYGSWKDDSRARQTAVLGAEAVGGGFIVVEVLKLAARRARPDAGADRGRFFSGGSSFPSGHTFAAFALASVVAHQYQDSRVLPIAAYTLAAAVGAARFSAQRHFPADIVVGGAAGWFIGRYVCRTHEEHVGHRRGWLNPTVTPVVSPGSGTFGIALGYGQP